MYLNKRLILEKKNIWRTPLCNDHLKNAMSTKNTNETKIVEPTCKKIIPNGDNGSHTT